MNLVDVTITKVLVPPTQVVNDEFACWEVTVETICWGHKRVKTFKATSKTEIDKYKEGYTWQE